MPNKMTKEKEVRVWRARLDASQKIIDSELAPKWRERLQNFEGRYWAVEHLGHKVTVNVLKGLLSLMIPSIYYRDPRVQIAPRRPGDERKAKLSDTLANYYLEELAYKKQAKRQVRDAFMFDIGYLKLGYEVEMEQELDFVTDPATGEFLPGPTGEPMMKDPEGNIYIERDGRYIQVLEKDGEVEIVDQETPTLNEFVRREQPYAIRWSPFDVLRDPEAKYADLSDARWVAFRADLPLDEVKGNANYRNTSSLKAEKRVRNSLIDSFRRLLGEEDSEDPALERVTIYEIWCKEWNNARKRYDLYQKVIAEGHDKFLLYRKSPYLAEGFPVDCLYFDEHPEHQYGASPLGDIDDQINSINITRAHSTTIREQQLQKWGYNKQFVTKEEFEEFAQLPAGGGVGLENLPPEIPIANVIFPFPVPQVSPDIDKDYDRGFAEMDFIAGVPEFLRTGSDVARQATQASYMQAGFNLRVAEKQDAVAESVKHVVRFWLGLLKQFGDYQIAFKITNDVGQDEWVQFKVAEAIPDEFSISIDVYQSASQSKEVQQKQALDRYNLLANNPLVNPIKLIEDVFKSFGIPDVTPYLAQQQMQSQAQPGQPGVQSIAAGGQAVDVNALRRPANTDLGATGRAAG